MQCMACQMKIVHGESIIEPGRCASHGHQPRPVILCYTPLAILFIELGHFGRIDCRAWLSLSWAWLWETSPEAVFPGFAELSSKLCIPSSLLRAKSLGVH